MAITTYAELQAAAANWLVRADLTARVPEFITLAEARLNRNLRARLAEVEQTLTATVGARTIPLPAGFAEPLALWILRSDGGRCGLRFLEPGLLAATRMRGTSRSIGRSTRPIRSCCACWRSSSCRMRRRPTPS
jgi:hypothetical protein